jgi:predicted Ser/Thr protein kinase
MNDLRCPRCRAPLAGDAPLGLCPECLLREGFESAADVRPSGERTATSPGERFVPPAPAELAASFPQLEIQELLGHGGMGAVYRARQRTLDRLVALKILPPKISSDPAFAERFQREARTLARLSHPNIVVIYEFGKADGYYYLLMEYVDGVNLRQAIQARTLDQAAALGVVPQICDALQYAHEEGIVHRDIKPENLLLDKRGRVKIADFGLAKLLGRTPVELTLTASHQIMGTLHYMAPEQFDRPLSVDHRADIYSLGVVFYELLTGELPLGRYPLPSEAAHVDVRLDQVVLKTLERKPEARYQHASEVKTDVESISAEDRPARAAPRRAPQPGAEAASQAERNVKNAAAGMMLLGALNVLLPVAVHIWLFLAAAVGFIPNADVDDFWYLFFSIPSGLLMLLGGWGMHRMKSYPLAMVGIVAAMIPCGPLWLASLPVAVLSLLALRQPGIPEKFTGSWDVLGLLAPVGAVFAEGAAADRVRAPGITLLVLGALNILIPLAVNMAVFMNRPDDDFLGLFLSIPAGVVMALGGWGMLQLRWYGMAIAGAVAAMVPCGPLWIISLPVGIWALIVLRSEDVGRIRRARGRASPGAPCGRRRRDPPADARTGNGAGGDGDCRNGDPGRRHADRLVPRCLLAPLAPRRGGPHRPAHAHGSEPPLRRADDHRRLEDAEPGAVLALAHRRHRGRVAVAPAGHHHAARGRMGDLPPGAARGAGGVRSGRVIRASRRLGSKHEAAAQAQSAQRRRAAQAHAPGDRPLLAGIVNALIAAGMAAAAMADLNLKISDEVGFTILFSSLAMGLVFIYAGTNMLRFRAYYTTLAASMLAIAPTSPAWPISIAFGINGLVLLASREMRREFEIERRRAAELV